MVVQVRNHEEGGRRSACGLPCATYSVWHASQPRKRMLRSSSRQDSQCRAGSRAEDSSGCLLAAHLCVVVQVLEVPRGHGPGDLALTDGLKPAGDNTEAQMPTVGSNGGH